MSRIEGFWVKNFGPLGNVALGTSHLQSLVVEEDEEIDYRLGPVTLFVGRSNMGKSSIMDVFHFLADAIQLGVEDACVKRGGIHAIRTQGSTAPISIGVNFKSDQSPHPLTYAINVGATKNGTAKVDTEALVYRPADSRVQSTPIMLLQNEPKVIKHVQVRGNMNPSILAPVKHTDFRHLALPSLGKYDEFHDVAELSDYLESWYLSCYTPHDALGLSPVVPQKHIHRRGDSLVSAVRELELKLHTDGFSFLLDRIAQRMPGIEQITHEKTEGGRILLFFKEQGCSTPFSAQRMSDGMLRLFAHLLLLEDIRPVPFVGVEEPENGLDEVLMELFIDSLVEQVMEMKSTQFFITTHSANLVDHVRPESVWLFEKIDGEVRVRRASDDPMIRDAIRREQFLAENWFSSGHFVSM